MITRGINNGLMTNELIARSNRSGKIDAGPVELYLEAASPLDWLDQILK